MTETTLNRVLFHSTNDTEHKGLAGNKNKKS